MDRAYGPESVVGVTDPFVSICKVKYLQSDHNVLSHFLDVADEMEYDERLAHFRQTRLNPFDRGEDEDGKTPPQKGNIC